MSERDPIHVETYHDAEAAFTMAGALWKGKQPTPEAFQATVATLMISMQSRRNSRPQAAQPAGRAVPAQAKRTAPSPAPEAVQIPACPVCGGEMWDNRASKKNAKAPDFRCKDKGCKDDKGYTPGLWLRDLPKKDTTWPARGHAPKPVPQKAEDFEQMPEQLDDDGEDLPF